MTKESDETECLLYYEKAGKTFHGGLSQKNCYPNVKRYYPNLDNPYRCHIRLFKKFLSVRPKSVNTFYLQPKKTVRANEDWYFNRPLGHNTLRTLLSKMCENAGVEGRKTNHCLRATLATRLHNANVNEQTAMEMTGHRSVGGIRNYKRTSSLQVREAAVNIDIREAKSIRRVQEQEQEQTSNNKMTFEFHGCNVSIYNASDRT